MTLLIVNQKQRVFFIPVIPLDLDLCRGNYKALQVFNKLYISIDFFNKSVMTDIVIFLITLLCGSSKFKLLRPIRADHLPRGACADLR